MAGLGEEVNRAEFGGAPAKAGEDSDIAGKGFRVAADIDNTARLHLVHGGNALRRAARAGRVEEDDVGAQPFACSGHHPFGRIGADKIGICNFVAAGIGGSVLDGSGVALDADDLLGVGRGAEADRADAAVGVNDGLAAGQLRQLQRLFIQHLGLGAVYLVKAARRDCKLQAAQRIQHKTRAVQRFFAVSQHGAGAGGVDILHDTDDPRRFFAQGGAEILAAGQLRAGCDEGNEHLVIAGAAQHNMAQQPRAAILVVGRPAAGAGGVENGGQCLIQNFLLQQAIRAGQDGVRALGVEATDELPALHREAGDSFIAVVERLGHALHGFDRGEAAQQLLQARLLFRELLAVGQRQQRAAAAFFCKIDAGNGHERAFLLNNCGRITAGLRNMI